MIILPSLPSGYTIFCDDIRQEVTGKVTLVGTYGTHLYASQFPALIPRICCSVTYREGMDVHGEVAIRVIHETGGEEKMLSEVKYEIPPDAASPPSIPDAPFVMREAKFNMEMSPFELTGPGTLKVRAYRDDNEIRLGILTIVGAEPIEQPVATAGE